MTDSAKKMKRGALSVALLALSMVTATSAFAQAKPNLQYLGLENPSKTMNVTVTLSLPNQAQLDALVAQIHDKSSPMYHKFLTPAQFAAQFAPSAAASKAVQNYLAGQGLTITYVDKFNLVVRASGSVANLQSAFSTQVGRYQDQGKTFNMPLANPTIPPQLTAIVKNVGGFSTVKGVSHAVRATDMKTGLPRAGIPVKGHKSGLFDPYDCFESSAPVYLYGTGLEAIYSGNGYTFCGYDPAEVRHAYGFDTVISSGLDGTGQTIVIVDAYGSNTLAQDVAAFDTVYGLPALNLNIINNPTGGTPDCTVSNTVQCGWEGETTLDVEWAHAMAPGATIDLIVSPTENFSDFANIDLWVAENIAPASVNHSFGFPEWLLVDYYGDTADYDFQYEVNAYADEVFGVSNNYSSGDSGDFYTLNESEVPDVSFPAGLPNVTSVGGTSLAIATNGSYKWEEGWGNNLTALNYAPPDHLDFYYGGGGGTSSVTAAPTWQSTYLGNTARQQPDVAFLADPFTGVEIVLTGDGVIGDPQYVYVYGGTSLASPMFTAVWSEVAQKVGGNLGNAAPLLYEENALFPGSFNDVQPVSSGANAHGTIFTNGIPKAYSQWDLAQPYQNSPKFWEGILNDSGSYYTVTFGTDSSLTTGPGWDNVTGLGTPNGAAFIAPW